MVRRIAVALGVACLLVLAACGEEAEPTGPAVVPTSTSAPSDAGSGFGELCEAFTGAVAILGQKGLSDNEIHQALLDAGWTAEELGRMYMACLPFVLEEEEPNPSAVPTALPPATQEHSAETVKVCKDYRMIVGTLWDRGHDHDEIIQALLDFGWTRDDVKKISVICLAVLESGQLDR